MRVFIAFCKKELLEYQRNYKLYIMIIIFFLFGLMSPLFAKMLPQLLNGSELEGIKIVLDEATAMDSWTQFYQNIGQMGILVLVIVFSGITASDLSKGTLINMLTKGLNRTTVIGAKFFIAVLIWTISYGLALLTTYGYTTYFWGQVTMSHIFLAFISPWVYGLYLIALMVLGGILFKSYFGSLMLTGVATVIMSLLSIVPFLQKYLPISLSGDTINLLKHHKEPADFVFALIICILMTVLFMTVSILVFRRKEI
jgi:ABC-2 type transport system permease protein